MVLLWCSAALKGFGPWLRNPLSCFGLPCAVRRNNWSWFCRNMRLGESGGNSGGGKLHQWGSRDFSRLGFAL